MTRFARCASPTEQAFGSRGIQAFTLSQVLVAMGIFTLVVTGIVVSQIGGMKLLNQVETGLRTIEDTQKALNRIVPEVQAAKYVLVGTGTSNTFTTVASGALQQGNAIHLITSTNTNSYIRYYLDSKDKFLKRTTNGTTLLNVVTNAATNTTIFFAESYNGTVLTNRSGAFILELQLNFDPAKVKPSSISTKISRRSTE